MKARARKGVPEPEAPEMERIEEDYRPFSALIDEFTERFIDKGGLKDDLFYLLYIVIGGYGLFSLLQDAIYALTGVWI